MKRTIFCVLIFSFAFGCVITAVSPFVFVYETKDAHSQLTTYEKGLPFPYIVETVQIYEDWMWWRWDPKSPRVRYAHTVGYEILVIPLLSSVLSNMVAVAGIIGIILIRAKQSSLRADRTR